MKASGFKDIAPRLYLAHKQRQAEIIIEAFARKYSLSIRTSTDFIKSMEALQKSTGYASISLAKLREAVIKMGQQ